MSSMLSGGLYKFYIIYISNYKTRENTMYYKKLDSGWMSEGLTNSFHAAAVKNIVVMGEGFLMLQFDFAFACVPKWRSG